MVGLDFFFGSDLCSFLIDSGAFVAARAGAGEGAFDWKDCARCCQMLTAGGLASVSFGFGDCLRSFGVSSLASDSSLLFSESTPLAVGSDP